MSVKRDLKRDAQEFVEKTLTTAEGKRPSNKSISQAVSRIVDNFENVEGLRSLSTDKSRTTLR